MGTKRSDPRAPRRASTLRVGRARRSDARPAGRPRLLVPFAARQLDPTVLSAALRIARAEESVRVPANLLIVPREFDLDAPVQHDELERAMPFLEAVELAARRAGVPVDARIERGRTPINALERLWEVESFERTVIPAPRHGLPGFSSKDLTWMLENAPGEALILRPASHEDAPEDGAVWARTREDSHQAKRRQRASRTLDPAADLVDRRPLLVGKRRVVSILAG
jgi:hypothetical protein